MSCGGHYVGGEMQFGKVQGGALLVLGFLLLALQLYFFHPFVTVSAPSEGGMSTSATSHGPLAGVVGGICVLAGAAIFFSARRKDEPPPQRAVK
jgi:hypothetical protein